MGKKKKKLSNEDLGKLRKEMEKADGKMTSVLEGEKITRITVEADKVKRITVNKMKPVWKTESTLLKKLKKKSKK